MSIYSEILFMSSVRLNVFQYTVNISYGTIDDERSVFVVDMNTMLYTNVHASMTIHV